MNSSDTKFQKSYLRREVETAGKRYEEAVEKVFALTEAPNIQPGSDLSDAIQVAGQRLRLYTGALRSLAKLAAEEGQPSQAEVVESAQEHVFVHE